MNCTVYGVTEELDMTERLSLSGLGTNNAMWSTNRDGAKTNAEHEKLCDQRRGREFTSVAAGAAG